MISMQKLEALAEITLTIEPEDVPIEGNASAIDEDTDRETVTWIRDQLDRGNEWAWCTVIVRARYAGLEGGDSLGCCSYESEEAFKVPGGYYDDMVRIALHELAAQLETVDGALDEVRL